jgi:ZU5 domain
MHIRTWLGCWVLAVAGVACGGEDAPRASEQNDAGAEQPLEQDAPDSEDASEHDDRGAADPVDGPAAEPAPEQIGQAQSAVIGREGGKLAAADGRIALEVPPGALSEPQRISIQEIENQAPGHTGKAFRLLPEGVSFDRPVKLTFHYDTGDVAGSAPGLLRVAYRDASASWHMLKNAELDRAAQTVRVETTHFSDWSLVLGAVLLPHESVVKVGQSIQLKLSVCLQAHVEGDDQVTVEYGYDCEEMPLINGALYAWSVNGVIGGDEVSGRLRPESDPRSGRAMYDAPRQKPAANPVAVSVKYRDTIFGDEMLVASVKVLDDSSSWTGTVTYEVEGEHAFPGESGFVGTITKKFHHKETFEIVGVRGKTGPSTYLRMTQTSDVSHTEKGTRTKQVYSSCQAGVPPILRHDTLYSIDKSLTGSLVSQAIEGRMFLDETSGEYHLSIYYESTPLEGTENVVDTYKEGCFGGMTDNSYDKPISSSEAMPYEPKVEGTIDPDQRLTLQGSYEVKFPNDILGTKGRVTWKLTRGDDGK